MSGLSVPQPKYQAGVPYEAATVPLPSAAASRSKINVSPTSNVKRYARVNTYDDVPCMQCACHGPTQHAILSQHSISDFVHAHRLVPGPNATAKTSGDPRTYTSETEIVMALAMCRAQVTMSRRDWRQPSEVQAVR